MQFIKNFLIKVYKYIYDDFKKLQNFNMNSKSKQSANDSLDSNYFSTVLIENEFENESLNNLNRKRCVGFSGGVYQVNKQIIINYDDYAFHSIEHDLEFQIYRTGEIKSLFNLEDRFNDEMKRKQPLERFEQIYYDKINKNKYQASIV
jgi:hypothetical protein